MIAGFIMGGFVALAASSLGLMEKALGPDSGRFPCVSRELIWVLRAYTVCLVARAAFIMVNTYYGRIPEPTPDQMITAAAMGLSHLMLLLQILRQRLPIGVWRRLQARHARVRELAKAGGTVGAVLARSAAGVDPAMVSPMTALPVGYPDSMMPTLERLDRLP